MNIMSLLAPALSIASAASTIWDLRKVVAIETNLLRPPTRKKKEISFFLRLASGYIYLYPDSLTWCHSTSELDDKSGEGRTKLFVNSLAFSYSNTFTGEMNTFKVISLTAQTKNSKRYFDYQRQHFKTTTFFFLCSVHAQSLYIPSLLNGAMRCVTLGNFPN